MKKSASALAIRVLSATPGKLLLYSMLLAPVSVAITAFISRIIEFSFQLNTTTPNSVGEIAETGIGIGRLLSALFFAPIVENFICLIWRIWLEHWKTEVWWLKPAFIAAIAALFHAAVLRDLRPLAVFSGFFVISALIVHVQNTKLGYWASVVHHVCINAITLSLAFWLAQFEP